MLIDSNLKVKKVNGEYFYFYQIAKSGRNVPFIYDFENKKYMKQASIILYMKDSK